ncbi:MAG: anti-sigma factor family protein [Fimbriimonadaceae bacterium]
MNNKIIQNYLDNQLSLSEKEQFESEIASNPKLAQEVESLKTFKCAIQKACLTESIPNLHPALANITRPISTNWFTKAAPYAIACFSIFAIGLAANRVISDRTNPTIAIAKTLPPEARLQTKSPLVMHWDGSDPIEGAAHIRKTFYRTFPTIALNDLKGANFKAAECGSCWINFQYEFQGSLYNIYGRCEKGNLNSGQPMAFGKQTFYTFSDAVGWYDQDMTYVCTGGTPNGRMMVSQSAIKRTSNLR